MRRDVRIPSEVEEEDDDCAFYEDYEVNSPMPMLNLEMGSPSSILRDSEDRTVREAEARKANFVKYAKMILPHIGLVLLLIFYLFLGATYFYWIESAFEEVARDRELTTIFALRNNFHDKIWNLTHSNDTVISRESFNGIGQEYFENLVTEIFQSYRNQFITEKHLLNKTKNDDLLWTYSNSVFFATAVLSTIGYGNLVPATIHGRIGCIVFALLGIPLLLVTIADIGKFLSEFFKFLYKHYQEFKRRTFVIQKQTRRFSRFRDHSMSESETGSSPTKAGSVNLNDMDDENNDAEVDTEELRVPVVLVLLVLVVYTALGGFLFQAWEGWTYLEAFYFCFITMATIGFGDIVPTEKVYTFFTMAYIIFGLSLATMCIDLAGTEYLQKIHYLGQKMDDAKGAIVSSLEVGEHLLKHNGVGFIKTAGGKLLHIRVSNRHIEGHEINPEKHRDILREPLSAVVQKLAEEYNIKILPDDITETEGYILSNRDANKPHRKKLGVTNQYTISRTLVPGKIPVSPLLPFVLKESNI